MRQLNAIKRALDHKKLRVKGKISPDWQLHTSKSAKAQPNLVCDVAGMDYSGMLHFDGTFELIAMDLL
jgi:hypothetical protein